MRIAVEGESANRPRFGPKPPVQIQQEMAIIVANGGRFWVWDNPTPESGLVPARHEYLAHHVKPWLQERRAWCLGTHRVPDVSLLNTAEAHYAVTDSAGPVSFNRRNNRIEGAANWLPRLHLNYEMVGDWRLYEQDVRSGVLVVEHPEAAVAHRRLTRWSSMSTTAVRCCLTGMGLSSGGESLRQTLWHCPGDRSSAGGAVRGEV